MKIFLPIAILLIIQFTPLITFINNDALSKFTQSMQMTNTSVVDAFIANGTNAPSPAKNMNRF